MTVCMTESSRLIGHLKMFQTADQACLGLSFNPDWRPRVSARYAVFDVRCSHNG